MMEKSFVDFFLFCSVQFRRGMSYMVGWLSGDKWVQLSITTLPRVCEHVYNVHHSQCILNLLTQTFV